MTRGERIRRTLNWINLSTVLGLVLARAAGCRLMPGDAGLIYASGYRPRLPAAAAFTVGNVVLFRGGPDYPASHPVLMRHEARHSSQYAACLGLPFLPLYLLAAGWSILRTGDPASRNPFERLAGLRDGGYVEQPVTRVRRAGPRR